MHDRTARTGLDLCQRRVAPARDAVIRFVVAAGTAGAPRVQRRLHDRASRTGLGVLQRRMAAARHDAAIGAVSASGRASLWRSGVHDSAARGRLGVRQRRMVATRPGAGSRAARLGAAAGRLGTAVQFSLG